MAAYCDCNFIDRYSSINNYKTIVKCCCGEEEHHEFIWKWEQPTPESTTKIEGRDVVFHPVFSSGTSIVRSDRCLKVGTVNYWEFRVLTELSGTDVMFGIGTDQVCLNEYQRRFVSAVGINSHSWGLSFTGKIQHAGVYKAYAPTIKQGCIVGICLDLTFGTLEFFVNRRSLGVAFTNIPVHKDAKIYAMISSTVARSIIRLINCTHKKESLQLRALKNISKDAKLFNELKEMPGLRVILKNYWFYAHDVRFSARSKENEFDILDEVVLPKGRRKIAHTCDDEDDLEDIYQNAHKIEKVQSESDDEADSSEFFDEFFGVVL